MPAFLASSNDENEMSKEDDKSVVCENKVMLM
jgi:hypothetical protein